MKYSVILLFVLVFYNSFSQNKGSILYEEDFQLSEKSYPVNRTAALFVLDSFSYYKRLPKDLQKVKRNEKEGFIMTINPEGENKSFVLVNDGFIYTNYTVLKNYLLVKDSLNIYEWELLNERKEILGYNCLKAKTTFRGRTYYAFYTPEIPIPYGPWKFQGLPGLILEVTDSENRIKIAAISTYGKLPEKKFNDLEKKLLRKKKVLEWDEFKKKYVKAYKNHHKNMKSRFSNLDVNFEYKGNIPMGFEKFSY